MCPAGLISSGTTHKCYAKYYILTLITCQKIITLNRSWGHPGVNLDPNMSLGVISDPITFKVAFFYKMVPWVPAEPKTI